MSADAQPDVLDVRFPTRRILAIIGDKWTTVVLYCLSIREHRRFNELQKQIPDISKKMLIQTLRNLERDGLLERTVPPKTEYRLTDNGHKLREPIAWLCEWGMNNREFIDGIIKALPWAQPAGRSCYAPAAAVPLQNPLRTIAIE
jgi:DNA-binding HxlR family transcriptional regulator